MRKIILGSLAAIAVTPVGQEWADSLSAQLAELIDSLTSFAQGLFS